MERGEGGERVRDQRKEDGERDGGRGREGQWWETEETMNEGKETPHQQLKG